MLYVRTWFIDIWDLLDWTMNRYLQNNEELLDLLLNVFFSKFRLYELLKFLFFFLCEKQKIKQVQEGETHKEF
jgi:hypothetical protein